MRTILRLTVAAMTLMFAGFASAGDITLTPALCGDGTGGTYNCWTSDQQPAEKAEDLAAAFGGDAADYTLAYKDDNGVGEADAPFKDYYTTYYLPADPVEDKTSAEIRWDGAPDPAISCSAEDPCYMAVKDGKATPNIYVFEVTAWDGMGSVFFTDFFCGETCPDGRNISHVSIWGGGSTDMPEPGTLALLGLGLLGMGVMRRRRTS